MTQYITTLGCLSCFLKTETALQNEVASQNEFISQNDVASQNEAASQFRGRFEAESLANGDAKIEFVLFSSKEEYDV